MKISDLKAKQGKVELEAKIIEVSPAREFQKFGRPGRVANSVVEDDTGQIVLTLWNEDVDRFEVGDTVRVVNGYVNEWQGELQLTAGRYGSLEKVGEEEEGDSEEEPEED